MSRLWALPNMKQPERKRFFDPVTLGVMGLMGLGSAGAGMMANKQREKNPPTMNLVYAKQGQNPAYMQNLTSKMTDQLNNMAAGNPAPYLQDIGNLQRKLSMANLQNLFFGNQYGLPGAFGVRAGYDAARGLGKGSGSTRAMEASVSDYTARAQAVEDEINRNVLSGSYNAFFNSVPSILTAASQDERAWGTPAMSYQTGGGLNNWDSVASALGSMGSAVPWASTQTPSTWKPPDIDMTGGPGLEYWKFQNMTGDPDPFDKALVPITNIPMSYSTGAGTSMGNLYDWRKK